MALRMAPEPLPLASLVNTAGDVWTSSAAPVLAVPDTVERTATFAVPNTKPEGTTRLICVGET